MTSRSVEPRSKLYSSTTAAKSTPGGLPHQQGGTWRPKDAEAYEEEAFRLKKVVAQLQSENASLKATSKRLAKQAAALQQQQAERHGPADVTRRLRAENEQLKEELTDRANDLADTRQALSELRQQVAARDEVNAKLKVKLKDAVERANRLSAAVIKNSATTAELKRELAETRSTAKAANDQCARLQQKKAGLKAKLASCDEIIHQLQGQNRQLQHAAAGKQMERALERYARPQFDDFSQLHLGLDAQRRLASDGDAAIQRPPIRGALSSSDEESGAESELERPPLPAVEPRFMRPSNSWDDGDEDWQLQDDEENEQHQDARFLRGLAKPSENSSGRSMPRSMMRLLSLDDDDPSEALYEIEDDVRPNVAGSLSRRPDGRHRKAGD